MAMIAINTISDEDNALLQAIAARLSYTERRRVSKSSLAREIVVRWINENATDEDRSVISK